MIEITITEWLHSIEMTATPGEWSIMAVILFIVLLIAAFK